MYMRLVQIKKIRRGEFVNFQHNIWHLGLNCYFRGVARRGDKECPKEDTLPNAAHDGQNVEGRKLLTRKHWNSYKNDDTWIFLAYFFVAYGTFAQSTWSTLI